MQHILSRIIIESKDTQFDDYQICLTKLFHCIGNNVANNILFCFTKTLSKDINNDQRDYSN